MTIGSVMLTKVEGMDAAAMSHADRLIALEQVQRIYDRPEHYSDPSAFFPGPASIEPRVSRVRAIGGTDPGSVVDLTWPSAFETFCPDVSDLYLGHELNGTAAARLFLHGGRARPTVILVHGYRCGIFALEERLWPVQWLYERGLDVALAVLPFHAVRARRGPPLFPSSDPRITNEGFRQAAFDLRSLAQFFRDRGAEAVGMMGMSLGGYTTGLMTTIDDSLDFAVPMIPCSSIADVARAVGLLVGTPEEQALQHAGLEAAHRVVSPISRPTRMSADRLLVIGAHADRITPISHAQRMAEHYGAPLETFHGGHLLQFGRGDAFRAIGRMLERLGIISARAALAA
jgi:pimeloyl-ACP methyl ester carboxylesterase